LLRRRVTFFPPSGFWANLATKIFLNKGLHPGANELRSSAGIRSFGQYFTRPFFFDWVQYLPKVGVFFGIVLRYHLFAFRGRPLRSFMYDVFPLGLCFPLYSFQAQGRFFSFFSLDCLGAETKRAGAELSFNFFFPKRWAVPPGCLLGTPRRGSC